MTSIWSAEVMRKAERGNGCDIQPRSRWMNIPTFSESTLTLLDIAQLHCSAHPDGDTHARHFGEPLP
jgi:hypothetical protein